ncbi:MAG: c-type cytochrome [Planctomycetales bacterium]|nr:c-type cytochrome [Planctomycetales bacterium]
MPNVRFPIACLLVAILTCRSTCGQSPKDIETEPTIAELAAKLPPIPPKTPRDSRDAIELHDDFRVSLVASEPLVHDPVAIDFDESGRMFVVELPSYNGYAIEGFAAKGAIRLLEDTDDDGLCDKSTIYLDDLKYPTAIACWDGGLFVGDAPDLLYVKDTDGDGKADSRKVVFTGFGSDAAGEAHLNSIRWGFDNRFHLSTSLSGGDIRVGSDPDASAVSVRGRGFVFDPRDLTKFELTSGGGQHGMSMDNWGNKFVCSNSVPAQLLMYDDRYVARNPSLQAPAAAVDIAPEGRLTHLFRVSPAEPWRELRTNLRKTGKFRGSDEGGKPFGFFTGATGITIYRGDAWPEAYRGNLFVGDVANNLVYRATLKQDGVGLVALRADEGREFFASTDIWTRPVQFANAPDGTLYVLDIYRGLIEGAAFLPPEFLKVINPVGGNDRGRIYRIEHRSKKRRPPSQLQDLSTSELVALLEHPNGWHRDTAARLLYQRQDRASSGPLEAIARSSEREEGRMAALYALSGTDSLKEHVLLTALEDASPLVRAHALRLSEPLAATSPAIVARICRMTDDTDIRVRYQLAFSLGAASGASRNAALAKLAVDDGSSPWFRLAILSSLLEGCGDVFEQVASDKEFRNSTQGRELLLVLAKQIGTANRQDEIAVVLKTLSNIPEEEKSLAESLVTTLSEELQGDSRKAMLAAVGGKAATVLETLLRQARATAGDSTQPIAARVAAIRTLRLSSLDEVQEQLVELLDLRQPVEVQAAVLQALVEFREPVVAELILNAWSGLSPQLRTSAAESLMSRPVWLVALLNQVERGAVARGDLDPARIELLKKHPDAEIAARTSKLFPATALPQRQGIIDQYQTALQATGVAERGRDHFKRVCSACHQLEGVGTAIGADLKGIRNRGLAAVMLNILDPNREVKPQFQAYVIVTDDGRVTTGMIQAENANSLTIRRADGTSLVIQRNEIEELHSTGVSFMPEGLEKQIDLQAMSDLLAYLDSLP